MKIKFFVWVGGVGNDLNDRIHKEIIIDTDTDEYGIDRLVNGEWEGVCIQEVINDV